VQQRCCRFRLIDPRSPQHPLTSMRCEKCSASGDTPGFIPSTTVKTMFLRCAPGLREVSRAFRDPATEVCPPILPKNSRLPISWSVGSMSTLFRPTAVFASESIWVYIAHSST
jgi:hypothetical protein